MDDAWDRIAAIRRTNLDTPELVSEWLMVLGMMTNGVPMTHERINRSLEVYPGLVDVRA